MKQPLLFLFFLISLGACNPHYVPTKYHAEEKNILSTQKQDETLSKTIAPYKDSLDKIMNEVLAVSDKDLKKGKPESELGNLLADMELEEARKHSTVPVDVAIINFGGIRLSYVGKGNITLGKAYEIMPFDNRLVLLQLDGASFLKLMNRVAEAGGLPIAGAHLKIANKQANEITVNGKEFEANKTYSVAISDYLANGGDNLDFLKPFKQQDLNILLRDAFIEAFKEYTKKGLHITAAKDGRVTEN